MIGSREAGKLATFAHETGNAAKIGNLAQTAEFGELIVVDATTPLKFEEGKLPELSLGFTDSAGESVQRWLPALRK